MDVIPAITSKKMEMLVCNTSSLGLRKIPSPMISRPGQKKVPEIALKLPILLTEELRTMKKIGREKMTPRRKRNPKMPEILMDFP
jgi:hypothetical protein